MKSYIENRVSLIMIDIQDKVDGNEILVSDGKIETFNAMALFKKTLSEI
jgi:hypothetical protein